jgi:hypothetical protein
LATTTRKKAVDRTNAEIKRSVNPCSLQRVWSLGVKRVSGDRRWYALAIEWIPASIENTPQQA